jgi:hypothetical protein
MGVRSLAWKLGILPSEFLHKLDLEAMSPAHKREIFALLQTPRSAKKRMVGKSTPHPSGVRGFNSRG